MIDCFSFLSSAAGVQSLTCVTVWPDNMDSMIVCLCWFSLWTDDNKLSTNSRTYFEDMSPLRWAKMERSRKLCMINLVHPFIEREILVLNKGFSFKLCCYNLDEEISCLQTNKNTFFFTS